MNKAAKAATTNYKLSTGLTLLILFPIILIAYS